MKARRMDAAKVLVFAGTTALVLAVLFFLFLGRRIWKEGRLYVAVFRGVSVSGLEEGSSVEYLGVPAGRVEQIRFQEGGFPNIVATLRLREDIPIQIGTRARLSFHPLTGLGRVVLEGGEAQAQEIAPGGEIATIPSFFDQLSQTLPGVLAKVPETLEELSHASRAIEDALDEPMRRRLAAGVDALAAAGEELRLTGA